MLTPKVEEEEEVAEDGVVEVDVDPNAGGDDNDTASCDEDQHNEPTADTFYKNMGWENEAEDCQVIQTNYHACKFNSNNLILLS